MLPGIEQMMTEAAFKEIEHLRAGLAAAHQRERIAVEAYERQQLGQRELEALYQAMTERAQAAEADASALRKAILDWSYAQYNVVGGIKPALDHMIALAESKAQEHL